jgi:NAD(P)-dependent dehydrogenase (short-subunit alcohol dehydrogenase family)
MRIAFHTALITGSSRGLGRGIAVKLAREGVKKIAVHYLTRKDEAEKTAAQLRDAGADGVLVQGDTSNASRAEEIVHEAAQKLGGCDIFVQSVIPRLADIYEHTLATEVPLAKLSGGKYFEMMFYESKADACGVIVPASASGIMRQVQGGEDVC